jgi:hypothetical protein
MMAGHESVLIKTEVKYKVLLERDNHVSKASVQVCCVVFPERIGHHSQTYQFVPYAFKISEELGPVSASKQRIATYRVVVGEVWNLALQNPSAAST